VFLYIFTFLFADEADNEPYVPPTADEVAHEEPDSIHSVKYVLL
jgi:hypothetical protein